MYGGRGLGGGGGGGSSLGIYRRISGRMAEWIDSPNPRGGLD